MIITNTLPPQNKDEMIAVSFQQWNTPGKPIPIPTNRDLPPELLPTVAARSLILPLTTTVAKLDAIYRAITELTENQVPENHEVLFMSAGMPFKAGARNSKNEPVTLDVLATSYCCIHPCASAEARLFVKYISPEERQRWIIRDEQHIRSSIENSELSERPILTSPEKRQISIIRDEQHIPSSIEDSELSERPILDPTFFQNHPVLKTNTLRLIKVFNLAIGVLQRIRK